MKKTIFCFQGNLETTEKVVNNLAKFIETKRVVTLISLKTNQPWMGYVTECWVDLYPDIDHGAVTVEMEVDDNGDH